MLERFKKAHFLRNRNRLIANAALHGNLVNFTDDFYDRYNDKILCGLPVAVRLKYYRPDEYSEHFCKLRAELLSYGFPREAKIFRANMKALELAYGANHSVNCWVEYGGWCFDPMTFTMARKAAYYAIQHPYPETIREICTDRFDDPEYADTYQGNIEKYLPGGEKRSELNAAVAVLSEPTSGSATDFGHEMRKFLRAVHY